MDLKVYQRRKRKSPQNETPPVLLVYTRRKKAPEPDRVENESVGSSSSQASSKKRKIELPLVEFDPSNLSQWDLMERLKYNTNTLVLGNGNGEETEWSTERRVFHGRVHFFISRMHLILGNRMFRAWKGSVLDSIVGVFLTQNVSDHLSSNAYMHLAAKFPLPTGNQLIPLALTNGEEARCNNPEPKESETKKMKKERNASAEDLDWQDLRRRYSSPATRRSSHHMDSVDWMAVRCANPKLVEDAIRERGQHSVLANRIQRFLNLVVDKLDGSYDLEWLRNVPEEPVKELLGGIFGLGLKSVECVRLLSLQQIAFPVDVNVARIAVRLGWVPLQKLPGGIQFHALEDFPLLAEVQKYLWPRLCTLDHKTLYQLHYHLISFGKAICTKRKPKCSICPMKGQCKRYATAAASERGALPPQPQESKNDATPASCGITSMVIDSEASPSRSINKPIIEFLESPEEHNSGMELEEPIIEFPESPERDSSLELEDIEDFNLTGLRVDYDMPMPKLKDTDKLKTVHLVIELEDDHPVLKDQKFPRRDPDDELPYLFAPWSPGGCGKGDAYALCEKPTCHSCNKVRDMRAARRLRGTILIPCRTAMNGAFPLNGTYFQVNEVFADDSTSIKPVFVSYDSIRQNKQTLVYFGSITSSIFKDVSEEELGKCFSQGYICVRAFNREKRTPEPLVHKFHLPSSKKASLKKQERNKAKGAIPDFSS